MDGDLPPERWLVVGLGNPGPDYADTRHNVGADAVRALARREGTELGRNKRVRCDLAEVVVSRGPGARLVLAVPTGYMNTSGGPTQSAAAWFKVPPDRLVVCHDELDLPVGALRVKRGGGNAGHKGLADIDRAFGTTEYFRVRIGIGRPPGRMPGRDYVLRRFPPSDRDTVDVVLEEAGDAVVALVTEGLEPTQNRYHARS